MSSSATSIDADTVARLASLARLALDGDEASALARDVAAIVAYVAQLSRVDVEGVAAWGDGVAPAPLADDVPRPGLSTEQALAEAARARDAGFAVPGYVDS